MLSSLGNQFGKGGHFKGAGDTIGDMMIEVEAKFFGGGRYRYTGILLEALLPSMMRVPKLMMRLRTRFRAPSSA